MTEILDLFILDSKQYLPVSKSASWEPFDKYNLLDTVYYVENNEEINSTQKLNPFYFVLYDDECIEDETAAALEAFCASGIDFVKFYKKEKNDKYSIVPRLFKSEILLPMYGTLPVNWEDFKSEVCLNGFLFTF